MAPSRVGAPRFEPQNTAVMLPKTVTTPDNLLSVLPACPTAIVALPMLDGVDRSFIRLISERTRETMFEITMLDGSLIVWGAHYRPDEFGACLAADGGSVALVGTLRDSRGCVVTFAETLAVAASFRVEVGALGGDFDPAWKRDRT